MPLAAKTQGAPAQGGTHRRHRACIQTPYGRSSWSAWLRSGRCVIAVQLIHGLHVARQSTINACGPQHARSPCPSVHLLSPVSVNHKCMWTTACKVTLPKRALAQSTQWNRWPKQVLALFVHECLNCCACTVVPRNPEHHLACFSSWFWLQAWLASAKLPSFDRYSYVT